MHENEMPILEAMRHNFDYIIGKFENISELCDLCEGSNLYEGRDLIERTRNEYSEIKNWLKDEYKKIEKVKNPKDRRVMSIYYPGIRDVYLELTKFGINQVTRKNINKLRSVLASAEYDLNYWRSILR